MQARFSALPEFLRMDRSLVGCWRLDMACSCARWLRPPQVSTATSPLVQEPEELEPFPFETQAAMRSGAQQSLVGLIRQAHAQSPWPIWLCGGDAPQLLPKLQEQLGVEVLHSPNLVMEAMVELIS